MECLGLRVNILEFFAFCAMSISERLLCVDPGRDLDGDGFIWFLFDLDLDLDLEDGDASAIVFC